MTVNATDELMNALTTELDSMSADSAERLTHILRGLFACMQDLNTRVAELEGQRTRVGRGEN
jgi:hypothetical protein